MMNLFKRLKYNPLRKNHPSNEKGVALLLATTSLLLMVYVASEVSVDSTIEYVVNSQEINRIKAYYSARNSVDIALLRIKVYQQASQANLPGGFAQQINQIWQFPFAWPLPVSEAMMMNTKDDINKVTKESLFDGSYSHSIMDEGTKIDINDLASPSKTLREVAQKQILSIFQTEIDSNEKFRADYQNFRFSELVNRISDWMSDKNESLNGGDKRAAFKDLGEGYPPNRGFRTLDELRLVPGMTEEFFTLLAPKITIYGSKAINPNTASQNVLRTLDSGMTDEAAKEAVARRDNPDEGGPFKGADSDSCRSDFQQFVESRGARLTDEFKKIPFTCEKVTNFKIEAIGRVGKGNGAVQKKIVVIVMDINKASSKIKSLLAKEKAQQQPTNPSQPSSPGQPAPGSSAGSTSSGNDPLPKGRPRIVYWSEY